MMKLSALIKSSWHSKLIYTEDALERIFTVHELLIACNNAVDLFYFIHLGTLDFCLSCQKVVLSKFY